jgi:hypothetical protein
MERRQLLQQQEVVTVSEYALFQRVSRALEKRGLILKKAKARHQIAELGKYFIVDTLNTTGNYIYKKNVNLEAYARTIDCLEKYEVVGK